MLYIVEDVEVNKYVGNEIEKNMYFRTFSQINQCQN